MSLSHNSIINRKSVRDIQQKSDLSRDNIDTLIRIIEEQQRQNKEIKDLLMYIVKHGLININKINVDDDSVVGFKESSLSLDAEVVDFVDIDSFESNFEELGKEVRSNQSILSDADKLRKILLDRGGK